MTFNEKIRNENLQYNFSRLATKIYVLSSLEVDKYEYMGKRYYPLRTYNNRGSQA